MVARKTLVGDSLPRLMDRYYPSFSYSCSGSKAYILMATSSLDLVLSIRMVLHMSGFEFVF